MHKLFIQLCSKNCHLFFKILTLLCIFYSIFFATGCNIFTRKMKGQEVYFEGPAQQTAMLYKVQIESSGTKYTSLHTLTTQSKYLIIPGTYLIANECTSYQFDLKENEPIHIRLNTFEIKFDDKSMPHKNLNNVDVQCFNKTTSEKTAFTNKSIFYILPGKNIITVSGVNVRFEANENETKNFLVHLSPLKLVSQIENDQTQFFIQPSQSNTLNTNVQGILQSGTVNQLVWLHPGKYDLEINGTKLTVAIEPKQATIVTLGKINILPPKNFLAQDRSKASGQPIFAYINKKVLFSLDKNYVVFPGKYTINLDNSEMEQDVEIHSGTSVKIQTYGAQINPPDCPETEKQQNCTFSQKVFIHRKEQPFVIAKIPLGTPFLVFQGEYQYSIEGMDGIMKNLPISSDSIKAEQIGKIKLKWKIQMSSSNLETRKIYIEPGCCGLYGKSDDLNSYRPRELLLPEGEYNLSYFVRQDKGSLKRNGTIARSSAHQINEIQIPIYSNGNQNMNVFLQDDDDAEKPTAPSTLTPVAP